MKDNEIDFGFRPIAKHKQTQFQIAYDWKEFRWKLVIVLKASYVSFSEINLF